MDRCVLHHRSVKLSPLRIETSPGATLRKFLAWKSAQQNISMRKLPHFVARQIFDVSMQAYIGPVSLDGFCVCVVGPDYLETILGEKIAKKGKPPQKTEIKAPAARKERNNRKDLPLGAVLR